MNIWQDDITTLMNRFEQKTPEIFTIPSIKVLELRRDLIREESLETTNAINVLIGAVKSYHDSSVDDCVIEVIDGLVDTLVVTIGTAIALGIDLTPFWDEVHRSNMSKLGEDGKPLKREDGKFLKGPNYSPPNLHAVLQKERHKIRGNVLDISDVTTPEDYVPHKIEGEFLVITTGTIPITEGVTSTKPERFETPEKAN